MVLEKSKINLKITRISIQNHSAPCVFPEFAPSLHSATRFFSEFTLSLRSAPEKFIQILNPDWNQPVDGDWQNLTDISARYSFWSQLSLQLKNY